VNFDSETSAFSGVPTEAGTFTVTVMAVDSADASITTTFLLRIDNASGLDDNSTDETIRIFPNPAQDKITISFGDAGFDKAIVKVTNIVGEVIYSGTMNSISTACINLAGNPKGIYFLTLLIDGSVINRKICLE
jgi:hypothetical protein